MRISTARAMDRSVILAATLVLASRQYGIPSEAFWRTADDKQPTAIIAVIALAGVFGVLTPSESIWRRGRLGRRVSVRRQILTAFGQLLELGVSARAADSISDFGLHVWQKKRTLRHPHRGELVRVATYRLGSTPVTRSIHPTLGLGVVGLCWKFDREIGMNVAALADILTNERAFERYRDKHGPEAVMGFSWEEFVRYRHRGAVFASPIRGEHQSFVGCVSFDADRGYDDLDSPRLWHELNSLCVVLGQDGFENV